MDDILNKLARIQAYGQAQTDPGTLPWDKNSWVRQTLIPGAKQMMAGSPAGSILQALGVDMPPPQNDLLGMIIGATGGFGRTMPKPQMKLGEFYRQALFEKLQKQKMADMMEFLQRSQNVSPVQADRLIRRID